MPKEVIAYRLTLARWMLQRSKLPFYITNPLRNTLESAWNEIGVDSDQARKLTEDVLSILQRMHSLDLHGKAAITHLKKALGSE